MEWEGRLEVCLDGRWGTVTAGSPGWPLENNHVVCGYFGYEPTGMSPVMLYPWPDQLNL